MKIERVQRELVVVGACGLGGGVVAGLAWTFAVLAYVGGVWNASLLAEVRGWVGASCAAAYLMAVERWLRVREVRRPRRWYVAAGTGVYFVMVLGRLLVRAPGEGLEQGLDGLWVFGSVERVVFLALEGCVVSAGLGWGRLREPGWRDGLVGCGVGGQLGGAVVAGLVLWGLQVAWWGVPAVWGLGAAAFPVALVVGYEWLGLRWARWGVARLGLEAEGSDSVS